MDKKLHPEEGSNAAVIAVGVIGGLIVVMLIAAGGFIGHKKYKEGKKQQKVIGYVKELYFI